MNTLISDLVQDAALVATDCLNSLPIPVREKVATALDHGGELEVRTRMREGDHHTVSLWLCNRDGQAVELAKVDTGGH